MVRARAQYLGWRGAALVTPIVCLGAGALFFAGALWPLSSVAAGGPAAALLALAPAAGIVAQVGADACLGRRC